LRSTAVQPCNPANMFEYPMARRPQRDRKYGSRR
jgi:hypothetical protein